MKLHYRGRDWALNPPIIDRHYSDFILERLNCSITIIYTCKISYKYGSSVFLGGEELLRGPDISTYRILMSPVSFNGGPKTPHLYPKDFTSLTSVEIPSWHWLTSACPLYSPQRVNMRRR